MNTSKKLDEIQDGNGELFHYTSGGGLKGILKDKTMWATQYEYLNDSTEMTHLGDLLHRLLKERARTFVNNRKISNSQLRAEISRRGGLNKYLDAMCSDFLKGLNEAIFKKVSTPYVTSFCKHDSKYESTNGLLSQWRGYGGAGYAIVFDRKSVEDAVIAEANLFAYQAISAGSAIYNAEEKISAGDYDSLVDKIFYSMKCAISEDTEGFKTVVEDYAISSSFIKHQGFREENELRIIASPLTEYVLEAFQLDQPHFFPELPFKKILKREHPRTAIPIPYIELFSGIKDKIKVNRIIVGPGPDLDDRFEFARNLVDSQVLITKSQTPFIG
ncbi:DUF2971 family protein [Azospirillum brasilense]|uniref:DUF2971 family protein n=1 Tax=Azospirillum brasilense TaxID=192 RepID=A0A560BMA5_AZOBR|nr:DUF2971 domain-containing protein [Azospirillum brasilense]TWA73732.1 DUF2971 family protein [Azospirillum brasilense]